MDFKPAMEFSELKETILEGNPHANISLIEKAYEFAKRVHGGQKRASGEEYFTHVVAVAHTLAELRLDSATIAAGLLHDTIEDCGVRPELIIREFGNEVFGLVEGTTKTIDIKIDKEENKAAYIRKVILATAKDIRVILIKLCDRLHNMRTLKYMPREKQILISQETLDIFAPIAYKLGMYKIKAELEDLCFRFLQPDLYQEFKNRMGKKREAREAEVAKFIKEIEALLKQGNIPARVFGRAKHFYSIYNKMARKDLKFEEVTDLIAVRVITTTVENCYKILGSVHSTWRPIPGKFDDYIANPKPNLYQSLHTEVFTDDGTPVEVQIRTLDMHYIAEEGVAAHWRYKGTERDKMFEHKINWLRQILTWKRESSSAKEFIENLKVDLFKDEIIVFTPKGDPITLPEDATPIDFAYCVHTSIGNHAKAAKINGKIAPLDSKLASGDVVEIVLQQVSAPNRQWLNFIKTPGARQKIRQALGISAVGEGEQHIAESLSEAEILSKVMIQGVKNHDLRYAKCCQPVLSDEIAGFMQKDKKVAVHKKTCPTLATLDPTKLIVAHFPAPDTMNIEATFDLVIRDRIGLLAEILTIVSNMRLSVSSISSKPIKDQVRIILGLMLRNESQIQDLMEKFSKIVGVSEVHLLHGKNRVRKKPHTNLK